MPQRKSPSWKCDVLVVGAGPAGSMAAREAATRDASVILLERRKKVGLPVRCAEFAPRVVAAFQSLKSNLVSQPIRGMHTILPGSLLETTPVNGLMVNRGLFDQALADRAVEAGARLRTGYKAIKVLEDGRRVIAVGPKGEQVINARVVVGADGPLSRIGKSQGCSNQRFLVSAQYKMLLHSPLEHTVVSFQQYIAGGYGWVFPKNEKANVGVGIDPMLAGDVRSVLDRFVDELLESGVVKDEILGVTGGYLPVGGLIRPWKNWTVLAGDAVGSCHPITGAGIHNALISGEMAGIAAAEAARSDSTRPLEIYATELTSFLGPTLAWAASRRNRMIKSWWSEDFEATVRQSWIAFREYYPKRRRMI
jgi:geranylgeranyl reductase family protein